MLTAFIKERHNDVDSAGLACCCGNNTFKVGKVIIRRHAVFITAEGIFNTVIGNIYKKVQILAANRFQDRALASPLPKREHLASII